MDKNTWRLVLANKNHPNIPPYTVIQSASYELVDHLMDKLGSIFKVMGYRTFSLMIICMESGAIIRDERSA